MASRKSVWRAAESSHSNRWSFEDGNAAGKGKGRWACKCCGYKVFHALTPKDPGGALQAHLRQIKRHEATCSGGAA